VRYHRRRLDALKAKFTGAISKLFAHPAGRPARKLLITVAGVFLILLGIVLIVLPGPALVLIPLGLVILAIEYPSARKWLRKFQRWITVSAKKADEFFARRKA
jgi:hypothetical protein